VSDGIQIRAATPKDAGAMAEIFNHYVSNTTATFGTQALAEVQMASDIAGAGDDLPWLVAEDEDGFLGYAVANPFKSRCGFPDYLETTIYLAPEAGGRGLGSLLYSALLDRIRSSGIRGVIAEIALPNPASVALHEKLGFVQAGLLKGVGSKFGKRIDVGTWQLDFPSDE